jgi:hypothetical protein
VRKGDDLDSAEKLRKSGSLNLPGPQRPASPVVEKLYLTNSSTMTHVETNIKVELTRKYSFDAATIQLTV